MRPERGSEGRRNQFVQQKANMERGRGGGDAAPPSCCSRVQKLKLPAHGFIFWKQLESKSLGTKPDQAVVVDYRLVWSGGATEEKLQMVQNGAARMLLCCAMLLTVNFMLHLDLSEIYPLRFFLYFVQKMRFSIFIIEPFVNFVIYCII